MDRFAKVNLIVGLLVVAMVLVAVALGGKW
jgi:hypothetical protein